MEVYTSIDWVSYKEKPTNEIPGIRRRMAGNWISIDVKELAEKVGNGGHTIVPGHLEGGIKAENCTEMQLLVLDFDDGVTFGEILGRCNGFGIPITFAYHTFSSTKEKEKFRVVFVYGEVLKDTFVIQMLLAMLYRIFPECDRSCKNLDRVFLGGKELIYFNENARISLVQLLLPFYQSFEVGDNFIRNIRSFCEKQKILVLDDMPAILEMGQLEEIIKNDGIVDSTIIHTIEESMKPSFFVLESKKRESLHQNLMCKEKTKKLVMTGDVPCSLLADFNRGISLGHNAKFAVCTNLLQINGGKKHFLGIIEKYYGSDMYEKWKNNMRYMKNYHPNKCSEEFCPYYKECENSGNIVNTLAMDRKIWREDAESYCSIEEARQQLRKNLEEAFQSVRQGIHLIRAQTGLGKTTSYIELMKRHRRAKFLVALPTNQLKEQVVRDLSIKLNEEIFMTVSIHGNLFFPKEVQDAITQAHAQGFHDRTKKIIMEFYETIKDDPDQTAVAEECRKVIDQEKRIKNERVVVTTHAFMENMSEEFLRHYTIIIDEDILMLQILNRTNYVSTACLQKLLCLGNPEYAGVAAEMLSAGEGEYRKIAGSPLVDGFSQEELENAGVLLDGNVNDIMLAGAFVRLGDEVGYFCPRRMPRMKYIVMSATLNERIYRAYFGGGMEIYPYPEKKARYRGELIQYTYHSLGRNSLGKRKDEVVGFIKKLADGSIWDMITFKKMKEELQEVFGGKEGRLHFGNTCGINSLEGHDIMVVGTPYKTDEAYKLAACYLGADVNREIDRQPKPRRVKYKGSSFLITTYDEPLLRELQLYSLESELEQCVGRARLLNKECTVYVLSAFPCEQAKLYVKDYLKED